MPIAIALHLNDDCSSVYSLIWKEFKEFEKFPRMQYPIKCRQLKGHNKQEGCENLENVMKTHLQLLQQFEVCRITQLWVWEDLSDDFSNFCYNLLYIL